MRGRRRIRAIALLLLTAAGFPTRASAEPEHIRIQFSAPPRCPDGTAFMRALRRRTGRFQLFSGTEQTRVFVVTITRTDASVSGRLEIQGPGTETSLRNVSGSSCDEVMAALALMTALAIDPSARWPSAPSPTVSSPTAPAPGTPSNRTPQAIPVSPLPPSAAAPAPLLATPPTAATAAQSESSPPRMDPTLHQPLPSPMTVQPPTMPSSMPDSQRWKWSAGAHGGVSLHTSPTVGLGGLLFVEAAAPGSAVLSPVLRTGLFLNQSSVTTANGAGSEFQWAAAMVEGCPIRLVVGEPRIALDPCLAFHLGLLLGQGKNLDRPAKTTDLWSDLGPVARIRVGVSARLFLEAQGMLVFPLHRLVFDMRDRGPTQAPTTVFTVPRLGVLAGFGVAYEFR